MNIAQDSVVTIHYTLRSNAGDILDSSQGGDPLVYLHGYGQIVPGLERALAGKGPGAQVDVKVPPEDGYGPREMDAVLEVPRNRLPPGVTPEVGMQLATQLPDGETLRLMLVKVTEDTVLLDANHPLAGEDLNFAVSVVEVRAATAEELQHGHVHGAGDGHGH